MKYCRNLFAAALVVFIAGWAAVDAIAQAPAEKVEILKVADVKTGMRGYGLTVFKGVKPAEFDAEVVGVLRNAYAPKRHVILVRCTEKPKVDYNQDGRFDESDFILTRGAISSGMSGSPVYLMCPDGKYRLIGAVALGWRFGKEPIAGVTPIEYMLDDMNTPPAKGEVRNALLAPGDAAVDASDPAERYRTRLVPLSTPLYMAGFSEKAFDRISKDLAKRNMLALQGGGGGGVAESDLGNVKAEAEPGATIGIGLMRGDMEIYLLGTLTYVDGDKFVAFGHTFNDMGECTFPVSLGYINMVFTSQDSSFKLGGMVNEVGYTTSDRTSALSGVLGDGSGKVRWIPATFKVASKDAREKGKTDYKVFKIEIADNELFAPFLLDYAFFNVMSNNAQAGTEYGAWATTKIKFKGYDEIVLHDAFSEKDSIIYYLYYFGPLGVVGQIMNNPYKKVELESVEVTLDYTSELKAADILEIKADKERAAPGEEVTLSLKMKTWRKEEWTETLKVKIPDNVEGDSITLNIGGGTWTDTSGYEEFGSVEDIIAYFNEMTRPDGLYVTTMVRGGSILYRGKYYDRMPPSMVERLMELAPGEVSEIEKSVTLLKKETGMYISGYERITIKIDRKEKQK